MTESCFCFQRSAAYGPEYHGRTILIFFGSFSPSQRCFWILRISSHILMMLCTVDDGLERPVQTHPTQCFLHTVPHYCTLFRFLFFL